MLYEQTFWSTAFLVVKPIFRKSGTPTLPTQELNLFGPTNATHQDLVVAPVGSVGYTIVGSHTD